MEELLKKWKDRLGNLEEMENSNENTLFKRLECELKIQELKTCYHELSARANSSNENSGLNIADVSQQRELFIAIIEKMTLHDLRRCYNGYAGNVFDEFSNK